MSDTYRIVRRSGVVETVKAATGYIISTAQHVATGCSKVSDEVYAARRSTCDSCDQRDKVTDTCNECKCPLHETILGDKLRRFSSVCPLNKWGTNEPTTSSTHRETP